MVVLKTIFYNDPLLLLVRKMRNGAFKMFLIITKNPVYLLTEFNDKNHKT